MVKNMQNIGFIGLGTMGFPMATHICKKSGFAFTGYDISEAVSVKLNEAGGNFTTNVQDIYQNCDVICFCLPKNELTENAIQQSISLAKENTILIDFGSTAPEIIQNLAQQCEKKQIHLLDCPVSGGEQGAIQASLSLMCGGKKEIFDMVLPILQCVGKNVTYLGESGNGSIAKLANNMIVGGNLVAMHEAFAFAVKCGLDPQKLWEAIKEGFAQSAVLDVKIPKILNRDFTPSAKIAVHQKDIKNAIHFAKMQNVTLPLSELVLDQMSEMEKLQLLNEDQCAMIKLYENHMHIVVK